MRKAIKIVEPGFEDNPGVIVMKRVKDGKWVNYPKEVIEVRSTLFNGGKYWVINKSQAKRMIKFLKEFSDGKRTMQNNRA